MTVRFDFRGFPRGYRRAQVFWLVLDRPEIELCVIDPGVEVDLYVDADFKTFARVWLGDTPFAAAAQAGTVTLKGPRELTRAFPSWLLLSAFAPVERPAAIAIAR